MGKFRSFSITHKGAKHEDDVPCQDASTHLGSDTAAIAVVADGHGSARCFRSDIGSEKVVEIAKTCVNAFVGKMPKLPSEMTTHFIDRQEVEISESKIALNKVVREIIDKWFAAVMKDEEEHPLKDDGRLEGIVQKYKDRYINDIDYRCHAYGTTLMVAVMGESYWFGFQVGDGKCVVLYEDGSWDLPIPWDDKCTFNTTTSICDDDSLSRFRYWFGFSNEKGNFTEYGYGVDGEDNDYVREIQSRPLAIFIGSDGVEDSYPRVDNDKYVINFYRNRIVSLVENGYDTFNDEIDGLAKRFADRESTDDVSIAGIIDDVIGKADIAKMKHDSEIHEAGEMASIKRRDADEKKDALDTVQKRTDAVTANQRQLESRIASLEGDIASLNVKKASFNTAFEKGKSDIAASDREMGSLQGRLREVESERLERKQEERTADASVTIAEDEAKKAKKAFDGAEKDYAKRQDALQKKQEDYNKRLQKLSVPKQGPAITVQVLEVAATVATYDANGHMQNQFTAQTTPTPPAVPAPIADNEVLVDVKFKSLKQEIDKIGTELQMKQAQLAAARQNVEAKNLEFKTRRQQLADAQKRTRQVETETKRIAQGLHTVEVQNRNQRDVVKRLQSDIAETERKIETKQAEIDKLRSEVETLKEQTKKQTDTLAQIKAAWEKAEAEAKALEEAIQNNNQSGEV